jgi:lysophospholipase L1-like esterase
MRLTRLRSRTLWLSSRRQPCDAGVPIAFTDTPIEGQLSRWTFLDLPLPMGHNLEGRVAGLAFRRAPAPSPSHYNQRGVSRMNLNRRQLIGSAAGCCALPTITSEAAAAGTSQGDSTASKYQVVLLGDSVFDNQRYAGTGPAVVEQVRSQLAADYAVTLLAVDGHTTRDISSQLERLPANASHLVVSVGGNDALAKSDILNRPATQASEVFLALAEIRQAFACDYNRMLEQLSSRGLPVVLSTIYDPRFADARQQQVCVAALGVFNDVITRAAASRGWPLLDLRVIFSEPGDYANAIEPGAQGGKKLARAIVAAIEGSAFGSGRTGIYV